MQGVGLGGLVRFHLVIWCFDLALHWILVNVARLAVLYRLYKKYLMANCQLILGYAFGSCCWVFVALVVFNWWGLLVLLGNLNQCLAIVNQLGNLILRLVAPLCGAEDFG